MLGMPAERHLAFGSYSSDPAMRDLRMTSHLARYSGVSFGAPSGRPARPSRTSTGRGGGASPRGPAAGAGTTTCGGAAARPPRGCANGSIGEYTPVKSGCVPCAWSDVVERNSRHRSADENTATVFDMMLPLTVITEPPAAPDSRPRCHQRA